MKRLWFIWGTLGGLATSFASASNARATTPDEVVEDAARTRARTLFMEGADAYAEGHYEKAFESFWDAYRAYPNVEMLRNLGSAEVRTGRYVHGARHLAHWLQTSIEGTAEERQAVRDLLQTAAREIGNLSITVEPPGAKIYVDRIAEIPPPLVHYVEPGVHTVAVTQPGYEKFEGTLELARGEERTLLVVLHPAPPPVESGVEPSAVAPASDQHGTSLGRTSPDAVDRNAALLLVGGGLTIAAVGAGIAHRRAADHARVLGDVIDRESAPCGGSTPSACGARRALDSDADSLDLISLVSFGAGSLTAVGTALLLDYRPSEGAGSKSYAPVYIGGALALAGLTAGVAFTVAADDDARASRRAQWGVQDSGVICPFAATCPALWEANRSQSTNRDLALTSFVLAGAEVVGVAAYLLWPQASAREGVAVTAGVTPRGVTLKGAF